MALSWRNLAWGAAIALAAFVLGRLAFSVPLLALVGAAACLLLGVGLTVAGSLQRLFLGGLVFILIGYAFSGRTFAYLGAPPVFIGEFVLAVGLLAAVAQPRGWSGFPRLLTFGVVAYIAWGATRTVPYIGTYGFFALRDGAAWAYALFALLVCRFLPGEGTSGWISLWYARLLPWFLAWAPLALLLTSLGLRTPLTTVKPGDLAVQLAGVMAFLLSGLYADTVARSGHRHLPERLLYPFWLLASLLVMFFNRAGTVAMVTAVVIVLLLRPSRALGKVAWIAGIILVASLLSVSLDTKVKIGGRETSGSQVAAILMSIGGESSSSRLEDTKRWRLLWWAKIWDYTVHGPYFWTGKGYGINLANDDGFQVLQEELLRGPHNGALTVLARAGVPGFAVWLGIQFAFAIGMLAAYLRALRAAADREAHLYLWTLAYWAAALVNSCFDVYLEGPQGAIWFWTIIGFGMAAQRKSKFPVSARPLMVAARGPAFAPSTSMPPSPGDRSAY